MRLQGRLASTVALLALAAMPTLAHAQREIVQPLPPAGAAELNSALTRLASNPTNVDALLDAGEAALKLGDVDAAIGFFGRASQLAPGNARIKLGLARSYVRSRRPIEALRLFAEAEQAGIGNAAMAEDRGLAFDLVGDAASAQALYRLAIANGAGSEARRRLALSQAISGDRKGFEATLLPLLEAQDVTAFRTRAFGLAILGDAKAAKSIADTMLPPGMGQRMASYLDFMPKLTRAQQAAAGNMGVFPRAANIGTDDAQVASYSGGGIQLAQASGSRIEPAGAALGATRVAQQQTKSSAAQRGGAQTTPTIDERRNSKLSRAQRQDPQVATKSPPPPPSAPLSELPPRSAQQAPATTKAPPVVVAQAPAQQIPATGSLVTSAPPTRQPASPPPPPPPPPQEDLSLEDAFASFTLPTNTPAPSATGAVDITRIAIPREKVEAKPPPPPPPPAHPARHWVQVATGKDTKALGFDWRRIARKAEGLLDGKGPFVTPWVEANRLLAGPYDNAGKAKEMVKKLKDLGIDSFTFDSAAGEKIDALK